MVKVNTARLVAETGAFHNWKWECAQKHVSTAHDARPKRAGSSKHQIPSSKEAPMVKHQIQSSAFELGV
jgi:hypothetical protein